jgi:hypothetical protein
MGTTGFSPALHLQCAHLLYIPESLVTVSEQTSQPVVFDNVVVIVIVVESCGGGHHTLGEVVMAAVQDTAAAAATTHTPSVG